MNENQYYEPIVQAMIATQQRQQQAKQLQAEMQWHQQQQKLQEQQLSQHQQEIENAREHMKATVDNLNAVTQAHIDQHHDNQRAAALQAIQQGQNPSTIGQNAPMVSSSGVGPLGQGAITPNPQMDPTKPPPTIDQGGGPTPIALLPNLSQMNAAQSMSLHSKAIAEGKLQPVPDPIRQKYGLPEYATPQMINTLETQMRLEGFNKDSVQAKKDIADEQNKTRQYVADQNNLTRQMLLATHGNASNDKLALNDAIRTAYNDTNGDMGLMKQNAMLGKYGSFSKDVADYADKSSKLSSPQQTKVAAASSTMDQVKNAITAIHDFSAAHPDLVGSGYSNPVTGVKRWFETKTGTEPDDIGKVDAALTSVAALQPQQHGFRSAKAMEDFKQSLGIDLRTNKYDPNRAWLVNPGKAISALQGISDFNDTLKKNILSTAGKTSAPTTIKMKAPNGQISDVDPSLIDHYKARGAVVVQ